MKKHNFILYRIAAIILIVSIIIAFHRERIHIFIKDMESNLQGKLITKNSVMLSWKISEDTSQILQSQQNNLNINRIFQYVKPDEFTNGTLNSYVLEMNDKNLSVYVMDGGYYWGTTDYGYEELLSFVDSVDTFNQSQTEHRIEGIVLDVEPAQDPEWNNSEDALMKKFVENMLQAYNYAEKKSLKVVVCVPNWYDEKHEKELRKLVEYGCDEIAVMNYSCGKEVEKIKTEIAIAKDYEKPIISIFEFAKPDQEAVFDQNTYYDKGVRAAADIFKEMDTFFNYQELTVGWHQLEEK